MLPDGSDDRVRFGMLRQMKEVLEDRYEVRHRSVCSRWASPGARIVVGWRSNDDIRRVRGVTKTGRELRRKVSTSSACAT